MSEQNEQQSERERSEHERSEQPVEREHSEHEHSEPANDPEQLAHELEEDDPGFEQEFVDALCNIAPNLLQEVVANLMFPDAKNPNRMLQNKIKKISAKDPKFNDIYTQTLNEVAVPLSKHVDEITAAVQSTFCKLMDLLDP